MNKVEIPGQSLPNYSLVLDHRSSKKPFYGNALPSQFEETFLR